MKVRASSLKEYDFCPRAIYLREVLEIKPEVSAERIKGLLGHAVRKELALRQPKMIKDAENVGHFVFRKEVYYANLRHTLEVYKRWIDGHKQNTPAL